MTPFATQGQNGQTPTGYGTPSMFNVPPPQALPQGQQPNIAPSLVSENPQLAQLVSSGGIGNDLLTQAVMALNQRNQPPPQQALSDQQQALLDNLTATRNREMFTY